MTWCCAHLLRPWQPIVAAILLLVFSSYPCLATRIAYEGTSNRPILFEDLGVDWGDGGGILYYDVTVTWDSPFGAIFG